MTSSWLWWCVAALAANAPFLSERVFWIGPKRSPKRMTWRLLELLVATALMVAMGSAVEAHVGRRHAQGWAFYAVIGCLMLVLAFPGFVWRHLRQARHPTG